MYSFYIASPQPPGDTDEGVEDRQDKHTSHGDAENLEP
jgi:hypothetical protein